VCAWPEPPNARSAGKSAGTETPNADETARERLQAVRIARAPVLRAFDVIEGREEETPAFAAQWAAEGWAAMRLFREAKPAAYVQLIGGFYREQPDKTDSDDL
jgi:hypothetical protein